MKANTNEDGILAELEHDKPNLTRIRAIAKEIGKDQALADFYWAKGKRNHRLLSLLVLDPKKIDGPKLDSLVRDIDNGETEGQAQLSDWLLSSVIMKKAPLMEAVEGWASEEAMTKQRLYWQFKARTIDPDNHEQNKKLLQRIEKEIMAAHESVRWTMNWCAASIGIEDEALRDRCIELGEKNGLYRDYPTPKGCTSPYMPIWISEVVKKRAMKK